MWVIREPAESEDRYFDRHFRRQGRVLWSVVSKTVDRSNHENGYFSFILCIACARKVVPVQGLWCCGRLEMAGMYPGKLGGFDLGNLLFYTFGALKAVIIYFVEGEG